MDKISQEIYENQAVLSNNNLVSTLKCFSFQLEKAEKLSENNLKSKFKDIKEFEM